MTPETDPFVLIVGDRDDWSIEVVAAALRDNGTRLAVFDTADFPQRTTLHARYESCWDTWLTIDGQQVRLAEVTAVYYRRPGDFDLPEGLSAPESRFARAQARIALGGLINGLGTRWLNHPVAMADAEYKPRQLQVAASVGLPAPATIITNNPAAVRRFATRVGPIVVKPLAEPVIAEAGGISIAYTRLLDTTELTDLSGVSSTAHLFQQWIDLRHAVRLTAVGGNLFAVAIHPQSEAARVDWRADYDAHRYELIQPPIPIRDAVLAYLKEFRLAYGAFDFVVSADGAWWFLECNSAGQWGWVAEACGLPIADAIADYLTGDAVSLTGKAVSR
ncbi:MAG: ATP-grasp ribosomal peptide maturase [Micromonosporaceae bacterium]